MLCGVALRRIGEGWEFGSEAALEDFIWVNLTSLLGLTPLKQQHPANGEVCDILAVDDKKQLVILELKNSEDRYVVQQLTRFRWSLNYNSLVPTEILHYFHFVERYRSSTMDASLNTLDCEKEPSLDNLVDFALGKWLTRL